MTYVGNYSSLDELVEAVKRLPNDLVSLEVQTDVKSHFTPGSIKFTIGEVDKLEYMPEATRMIVTKALEDQQEDDPVDTFILNSYFGSNRKKNDMCYIRLSSKGSRQFAQDMSDGKYGSLD